ncbi:zinc-regulated TonB-dependent outer membrane receptor [Myxococcaceae bacterium GXIMD 01537]
MGLSAPAVFAQEPTEGLTPEEQREIEAATGQDAAAVAEQQKPAEETPATGSSSSVSISPSNINLGGLNLSFILDVAAAGFSSPEPLQLGGHDPTRNGFNFQQLELAIGSVVDPYFRFDGNIVFSQFGVEVEEAYATTLELPAGLQVRAGQFLTRFGRINSTHPHTWDFVDQPFAIGRVFGGEGNRGLGTELSWLTPLPWYVEAVGSITDPVGASTARSFFGSEDLRILSPLDLQLTGALKQFFPLSDDWSLMWGLSTAIGPNPSGYRNYTNIFGTDVYLKYRPITGASNTSLALQAEVFYRRRQVPDDVLSDVSGYAQLVWRFSRRWATGARYEFGTPTRGQDGRIAADPLDPEWTADRQRVSADLTFWPTEFSRLRLQGATDFIGWRDKPDYSVFLALETVVGAHGSHAF